LEIKTKIVSCHTADFKPVKHEVNGTVILPPLVFPAYPVRGSVTKKKHFINKGHLVVREQLAQDDLTQEHGGLGDNLQPLGLDEDGLLVGDVQSFSGGQLLHDVVV
jgi:hypothetical protein